LDARILGLIATVVACCEGRREPGPGHPPAETVRVLATLRQFLREGTPWRSLRATEAKASGSTLRRWLERWARTGVLARMHALLVAMLRGHPDLILDTCSGRAKRGGELSWTLGNRGKTPGWGLGAQIRARGFGGVRDGGIGSVPRPLWMTDALQGQ